MSAESTKSYGVGIDTHSKFITVAVITTTTAEPLESVEAFPTHSDGFRKAEKWMVEKLREAGLRVPQWHYNIESTGTYHFAVIRSLCGVAHVVNPLQANPTRRKTDPLDAKTSGAR